MMVKPIFHSMLQVSNTGEYTSIKKFDIILVLQSILLLTMSEKSSVLSYHLPWSSINIALFLMLVLLRCLCKIIKFN